MRKLKNIKYIGFYDLLDSKCKRSGSLVAINKMNYIANSISNLGVNVSIISPAWILEENK